MIKKQNILRESISWSRISRSTNYQELVGQRCFLMDHECQKIKRLEMERVKMWKNENRLSGQTGQDEGGEKYHVNYLKEIKVAEA